MCSVYFDEMCQRNMDSRYSTERPVRRRPEFLSAKDLEQELLFYEKIT